jgi:alkaline phosphatase
VNTRFALRYSAIALLIAAVTAWTGHAAGVQDDVPRNVILFVGDGMGVSHVTAGKIAGGSLNLERFKVMGLLTTYSQDALITDSAAAATALATGHKSYNGAISVSPEKTPLKTVFEYAEEAGKATGLVASCAVTHATPAAFVSHVDDRGKYDDIAEQIAESGVDVLFGGGLAYFTPKSAEGSNRQDEKDLLPILEGRMKVVFTPEEFAALDGAESAAGLFAGNHPARAGERAPGLAELTEKALEILSKAEKGFCLMVEGSQIDWAAHNNDEDYLIAELLDFDGAVGAGLDFAERDGRTLVLVTADHETGGFAVHEGSIDERSVTESGFTTKGHTACMVPIFAYGPGSSAFGGMADNTSVGRTMIEYVLKSD